VKTHCHCLSRSLIRGRDPRWDQFKPIGRVGQLRRILSGSSYTDLQEIPGCWQLGHMLMSALCGPILGPGDLSLQYFAVFAIGGISLKSGVKRVDM